MHPNLISYNKILYFPIIFTKLYIYLYISPLNILIIINNLIFSMIFPSDNPKIYSPSKISIQNVSLHINLKYISLLNEPKSFLSFTNCKFQPIFQMFPTRILRQIQLIHTSMCCRQPISTSKALMYLELLIPSNPR